MSYAGVTATATITVLAPVITLNITPGPPWVAGQTITLKAQATYDTTLWRGVTINFWISNANAPSGIFIGSATTDAYGVATLSWQIPWKLSGVQIPGYTNTFWCNEATTYTQSNTVSGKVAFPTRLSISAPATVVVGEPFTISGKLEYEYDVNAWTGIGNMTISLYYDGNKIADTTTGSDGSYSYPVSIKTPGKYTLKAVFAGYALTYAYEGLILAPSSASLTLGTEGVSEGAGMSALLLAVPIGLLAFALFKKRGRR
jgi:hypothetical protein